MIFMAIKKNKNSWYYALLVLFILISGLQYMVGTDIPKYMEYYDQIKPHLSLSDFISGVEERKQPGWVLLSWFSKQISDNFVFLKFLHAIILNIAVFSFFKKESKYSFLCVFFYAFSTYLVLNFNVMRQSLAVAFGLYAISYIRRDRYLYFLFFSLFAFMFHNSGILLLIIPLFKFFKISKKTRIVFLSFIVLSLYVILSVDFESIANNIFNSGIMSDTISSFAVGYMNDDRLGIGGGVAQLSIHVILVVVVLFYYLIHERDFFIGGLGSCYLFVLLLSSFMPILWRFRLYFDFPYYVLLANVIIKYPHGLLRQYRCIFYVIAVLLFCYYPYRDYFNVHKGSKYRYIDQYYPYHSVFDPIKEKRI